MGNTGVGIGAFGAGLAKSLTDVLMTDRQRKREEERANLERQDRLDMAMLPIYLENVEDVSDLEPVFQRMSDRFKGKDGKSKWAQLAPFLAPLIGKKRPQGQTAQAGAAPSGDVGSVMDPGAADVVTPFEGQATPSQAMATAAAPAAGQGKAVFTDLDTQQVIGEAPATGQRRTLMGVPIMSAAEKQERAIGQDINKLDQETRAKVDLARRMLPQLKEADPTATMDDALAVVGIRTPSATARSAAAMRPQSVRGQMPDGTPAFGVFDPTTRQYIDPDTQQPLKGFRPLTAAATQTFGVDREAIAKSVFDKPFRELTSQEAAIVLREEKKMLQQEGSARALGAGEGRFQAPIDVKTAQETGLPTGVTSAQVAGQVVPTQQIAQRRRSVTQLQEGLIDIRDRLLVALPRQDELGGLAPGAAFALRRRLPQYRNQIASLEAAINNVVNVMARSVGEQVGAQTERDALRAEAAIASLRDAVLTGDTRESATARINESLNVLNRILGQMPPVPVPTGNAGGQPQLGIQPAAVASQAAPQPGGTPAPATIPRSRAIKDAKGNWVIATP